MAAPASQGSPSSTYTLSPSPRPHSARAKAFQEATFSGVPRQDSLGPVIKRLNWEKQQPGWGTARAVATGAAGGGGGEVTTSKTTPKTKKSSPKTKQKQKKNGWWRPKNASPSSKNASPPSKNASPPSKNESPPAPPSAIPPASGGCGTRCERGRVEEKQASQKTSKAYATWRFYSVYTMWGCLSLL